MGSEYCPGYTDILGIWTPGFYCPDGPDTAGGYLNIYISKYLHIYTIYIFTGSPAVFCCGPAHHKYCCTASDQGLDPGAGAG